MRSRAASSEAVSFNVQETLEPHWLGLFLGSIAMVPFVIGAVSDWLVPAGDVAVTARLTVIRGSAILSFLAESAEA